MIRCSFITSGSALRRCADRSPRHNRAYPTGPEPGFLNSCFIDSSKKKNRRLRLRGSFGEVEMWSAPWATHQPVLGDHHSPVLSGH